MPPNFDSIGREFVSDNILRVCMDISEVKTPQFARTKMVYTQSRILNDTTVAEIKVKEIDLFENILNDSIVYIKMNYK